jgi:hypothetical protein
VKENTKVAGCGLLVAGNAKAAFTSNPQPATSNLPTHDAGF